MSSFTSKHIVITGAVGSLGSAMARYFLAKDWFVTGIDRSESHFAEELLQHTSFNALQTDLSDENHLSSILTSFFSDKPAISTWVNNAGFIHSELLVNLLNRDNPMHSVENFNKVMSANTTTTFLAGRWIASYFVQKRIKGSIINISSISAQGNLGQTAYAAAKAAVEAMTKVWAKELGRFGIRANCIAPGFIESESAFQSLSEQKLNLLKKETPLGRLGNPDEVAQLVELISENGFINGQIIGVDGGLTLHS